MINAQMTFNIQTTKTNTATQNSAYSSVIASYPVVLALLDDNLSVTVDLGVSLSDRPLQRSKRTDVTFDVLLAVHLDGFLLGQTHSACAKRGSINKLSNEVAKIKNYTELVNSIVQFSKYTSHSKNRFRKEETINKKTNTIEKNIEAMTQTNKKKLT